MTNDTPPGWSPYPWLDAKSVAAMTADEAKDYLRLLLEYHSPDLPNPTWLRRAAATFDRPTDQPSEQELNLDPLILDSDKFPEPMRLDGDPSSEAPLYNFDPSLPLSQPHAESWIARLSPAERLDVLVRIACTAPKLLYHAERWSQYFAASRLDRSWGTSVSHREASGS